MLITSGHYIPPKDDELPQVWVNVLWNEQNLPLAFDVVEDDDGVKFYLLACHPHSKGLVVGVEMDKMKELHDQLILRLSDLKAAFVNCRQKQLS